MDLNFFIWKTMGELQIELTKLIGSKELSFGCLLNARGINWRFLRKEKEFIFFYSERKNIESIQKEFVEIIGHPATLSDLHKFLNDKIDWSQSDGKGIEYDWDNDSQGYRHSFCYESWQELMEQSDKVLQKIIDFIKANQ